MIDMAPSVSSTRTSTLLCVMSALVICVSLPALYGNAYLTPSALRLRLSNSKMQALFSGSGWSAESELLSSGAVDRTQDTAC